jgi:hypothetical protein
MAHVKEVGSVIHRCLRLELIPMFRAMGGGDDEMIKEHEAM